MTEYQVYGKNGLFHNIVKASKIMNGRYAVLPKGGSDLNTNNVLTGIEFPKAKYPMVACLMPMSVLPASVSNQFETFNFTLFFLTTTYNTGDNKLKKPDPTTNSSLHTSPEDWSDMKQVMLGFMNSLEKIGSKLRGEFRLDQKGNWLIGRISHYQNDNVSGVFVRFSAGVPAPCEFPDITLSEIVLPTIDHPEHFH